MQTTSTTAFPAPSTGFVPGAWSAVGSMTLCVFLLIAAEFMPVSLLTPMAQDLHASAGMTGQAISVSGLFAVLTSLLIAPVAGRFDRRMVLVALTGTMLASLVLIALAPSFAVLMAARALLGVTVGGFWALSTATVMRLVPREALPRAMGVLYMGNAVATAVAAPLGSYLGGAIGWRGVFWILVPLAVLNLAWQWTSLPSLRTPAAIPLRRVLDLLKRRNVAFAMLGVMLSFGGAFATFTYLRPFLETSVQATLPQISALLLGLGAAGFVGTSAATALLRRHLYLLLGVLPLALAAVTLAMLAGAPDLWVVGAAMVAWGALNAAIPVCWSNWLAQGVADEPEAGGGLMIAAIQLAIMLGATLGGWLLDQFSISAAFLGGAALLVLATLAIGRGTRLQPLAN
jgi:predicted MFS family arabinose efflux permease